MPTISEHLKNIKEFILPMSMSSATEIAQTFAPRFHFVQDKLGVRYLCVSFRGRTLKKEMDKINEETVRLAAFTLMDQLLMTLFDSAAGQ